MVEALEVRAYRWRHTLVFSLYYVVGLQLYSLLRRGSLDPEGVLVVACLTPLGFFLRTPEHWHLRIVNGVFSGPPPFGWRRVEIPVADIDRVRSAKPNLFGSWTVYSTQGAAIQLHSVAVPKAGRLQILRALGLVRATE